MMRRKITIAVFMALLAAPLFASLFGVKSSINEKRNLAELPRASLSGLLDSSYYSRLGDYYDDRFPFRGWLIRSKNWIDYYLFRVSPSAKVHLGRDGWLYDSESLPDYLKNSCGDRERMRALAKDLHDLEKALASMGKKFVFVVSPNKATIYPEHVDIPRPEKGCGKSRYDLLLEAFGEYPVSGFVRLDLALKRAKQTDGQIYYRTDEHWNMYGAIVATREIAKEIDPATWYEFMPELSVAPVKMNVGLAETIGLDLSETFDYPTGIDYGADLRVENPPSLDNGRPRFRFNVEGNGAKRLLPRAVLYRDSFMTIPLLLLRGSFVQLDALWTTEVPTAANVELMEFLAARVVIVEVVERHLGQLELRRL